MKEYRLAKVWRIVTYLLSPAFIALGIFVISKCESKAPLFQNIILIISGIGIVMIFVYAILDARAARLVIGGDYIYYRSLFSFRKLRLDEIKAYSLDENYIHVLPIGDQKKLKVSRYYGRSHEIIEWLDERFSNADDANFNNDLDEILSNDEFGNTEEAREAKFRAAKRIAKYLNGIAWVTTLWIWFYPTPYFVLLSLNILLPIVVLYFCYSFRGIFKSDDNKGSAYPSMAVAFILPGIGIALRALLDFTVLDYSRAWPLIILTILALAFLYLLPTGGLKPKNRNEYLLLVFLPILTFFYAFGTCVSINCAADKSPSTNYNVKIIEKHVSTGKHTTYNLKLAPWGDQSESKDVNVSRYDFDRVQEGDLILVKQRPGYIKLPWIEVVVP